MPSTLSLLDVAALIAESDGLPFRSVPTTHRRIRQFVDGGLIPSTQEEDGRREHVLDRTGASMARIFHVLVASGYDIAAVKAVREGFRYLGSDGLYLPASIIEDVEQGKIRCLRLSRRRDIKAGREYWTAKIAGPGISESDRVKRLLDQTHPVSMTVEFDLGPLLLPVIERFSAD